MLSCFIQSINHGRTLSPLLGGRGGGKHSREQKPEQRLNMKGDTKEVLISIHITRTRATRPPIVALWCHSLNSAVRTHVYVMLCLDALSQVAGLQAHFYSNVSKLDDQIRSMTPYGLFGIIRVKYKSHYPSSFCPKGSQLSNIQNISQHVHLSGANGLWCQFKWPFPAFMSSFYEFVLLLKAILPCLMFVGSSVCILADETISTLGLLTHSFWSFRQCQMLFITRAYA